MRFVKVCCGYRQDGRYYKKHTMKSLFSVLLIILLNHTILSQSDFVDLSKIKLCETKISDFEEPFTIVPVTELDVCSNGIIALKIPGYQNISGFTFSSFKNVIFQIHLADSTVYKIILNKDFKGYLTDGKYIDLITLKAKDIKYKNSIYWFKEGCSEYVGLGYKNFKFHIKQDKSILSKNTINQELYSEKNIEIVTIQSNCYKRE
jgi:hypothetical protein